MSNITHGFSLHQTGNIGQEIISPRGNILAWTTDPIFGAFIVRVLNAIFSDDEPLEAIFEGNDIQAAAIKAAKRRMTND
jgi:hypothetical protein